MTSCGPLLAPSRLLGAMPRPNLPPTSPVSGVGHRRRSLLRALAGASSAPCPAPHPRRARRR
ncbi:MAG: hypothetical protein JWM12_2542 [Ilumatobacteraceae bacterium]|nr:hypothetical protein [Ilumatobacteraceae bacterium]